MGEEFIALLKTLTKEQQEIVMEFMLDLLNAQTKNLKNLCKCLCRHTSFMAA